MRNGTEGTPRLSPHTLKPFSVCPHLWGYNPAKPREAERKMFGKESRLLFWAAKPHQSCLWAKQGSATSVQLSTATHQPHRASRAAGKYTASRGEEKLLDTAGSRSQEDLPATPFSELQHPTQNRDIGHLLSSVNLSATNTALLCDFSEG